MNKDQVEVQLIIQEMRDAPIKWPWKGKPYAATPSTQKPAELSTEAWAIAVLRAARHSCKFRLVIPRSFYPGGLRSLPLPAELTQGDWIELMDMAPNQKDYDEGSPLKSFGEILRALKAGEDVLVPSLSEKISGFLPLFLSRIRNMRSHVVKVWSPVMDDYELSEFHMGYVYGLTDGRRGHFGGGVNQLRRELGIKTYG